MLSADSCARAPRAPADPATFKAAMAQLASGVTIVTIHLDGEDHGFTATSFTSVSVEPMLALVCVTRRQRCHAVIEQAGHFAVNVLSAGQRELGVRFASAAAADRFAGLIPSRAHTGAPVLDGSLAWFDCRLRSSWPAGDHTIFVGEAVACHAAGGGEALVYHDRRWGRFSG